MLVQTSALGLALLLGFGLGVTFQSDRDAGILAAMAPAQSPAPAAPPMLAEPAAAPQPQAASSPEPAAPAPANPSAPTSPPAPAGAARANEPADAAQPIRLVSYAYVYRYEKDGGFGYESGLGKFENVSAARTAAISECQRKGGRNCKFNFAPAGLCIAVARPPSGQYRVSGPLPDEASASASARALCLDDYGAGCRVEKVLCP